MREAWPSPVTGTELTAGVLAGDERLRVVRADTLQIGEEEGEGAWVKRRAPISVIVGNPPYEREAAGDDGAHKGGWCATLPASPRGLRTRVHGSGRGRRS